MCEDSIHMVRHAIVRTAAAVDRHSSFRPYVQTIKRIDEVENEFISCATVRSTSFVYLHIIIARWRTGSSVRESRTVLLEDEPQAPFATDVVLSNGSIRYSESQRSCLQVAKRR